MYMENLLAAGEAIVEDGVISAPAGRGRAGFVAASDVGAVAARVLTGPGHEDATYVLTGPAALGYADVAERISAVVRRHGGYASPTAGQARHAPPAAGPRPAA